MARSRARCSHVRVRSSKPGRRRTTSHGSTTTLLDARPDANPNITWNATRLSRHADHLSLAAVVATQVAGASEVVGVTGALVTIGTVGATGAVAKSATTAANAEITWNWRAS